MNGNGGILAGGKAQASTTSAEVAGLVGISFSADVLMIFQDVATGARSFTLLECVPGELDTNKLVNGDYIDPTIIKVFKFSNQAIHVIENCNLGDKFFESVRNNLASFFSSLTMEHQITDYTTNLTQQVLTGTLSNDDFNKSITNYTKQLSDNYPNNYFDNLSKINESMNKNSYIFTKK